VPVKRTNGVELFYEVRGAGEPLVLVHGSWGDHHQWDPVVGPLSEWFEVVVYDRRGHSQSERPAGQGSVHEDADDLAELIKTLGSGPAHVVANSYGSIVALNAAIRQPDVFATLVAHEPPLTGILAETEFEPVLQEVNRRVGHVIELLDAGDDQAGAKLFVVTVARRPGAWEEELTAELREVFMRNAPTFLDEARDPHGQRLDLDQLPRFDRPALLTKGSASPPFLIAIVDTIASLLPRFEIETIEARRSRPAPDHNRAVHRSSPTIHPGRSSHLAVRPGVRALPIDDEHRTSSVDGDRRGDAAEEHRLHPREAARAEHDRRRVEFVSEIADRPPRRAAGEARLGLEAGSSGKFHAFVQLLLGDLICDLVQPERLGCELRDAGVENCRGVIRGPQIDRLTDGDDDCSSRSEQPPGAGDRLGGVV
jgi:pimeloyl-ACP methyl ester carboxylesterase